MKDRAIRRARLQVLKARARRLLANRLNPEKDVNHLASCSCMLCQNPRRFGELTIQEQRANQDDPAAS